MSISLSSRLDAKSKIAVPSKKPRLRPAAGGQKQTVSIRWPSAVRNNRRVVTHASRHDDGSGDYDYIDTEATVTAASVRRPAPPPPRRHINSLVRTASKRPRPWTGRPHHPFQKHLRQQLKTRYRQQDRTTSRGDFDSTQFYPVRLGN